MRSFLTTTLAGVAFIASGLAAQAPARQAQTVLAIVQLDRLPFDNAKAVVVRRKNMQPQNVILVTRETSAAELTRAVSQLFASRRARGDDISANMVSPVPAVRGVPRGNDYNLAARDLAALAEARPSFIEGVGLRKAVYARIKPVGRSTGAR